MSGIGTGYDLSPTTYSPDGKVFQSEYAQKAVDSGSTVVGLKVKDGVVMGVEKLIVSKLLVEGSNRRIFNVDRHAGMAVGGLAPDGRVIVNRAMDEASNYKRFYGDNIPALMLAERVATFMHLFNLYWSFRPLGSSVLMGAYDKNGPQLYALDPLGTCLRYFGAAVGKGRQAARNEIEKLKLSEMTARQAVIEVAKILHRVHDEDGKPFDIEISWVCEESGREHQRVPQDLMAEATQAAKAAMAESDMED
uniref:Proteasome subunit alpha type-3 n=1 Tax=Dunaliella tertiolecta TaxID=3047 RepID=A0A7S3VKX5_DUNTE|mmetsp:Transcript_22691/g.62647  ORF Transcript_22691/g.62647 Transcript_22691/m.62647 type:complete len:250 (+) Transcript_22691:113-862(+)|eukprot:CAMPEP_0202353090 /NCGR_PEP_ID=MMETSP1126-20121109/9003_1 /ASSEMBLY_ACC=CAM_ASM_000457 /TAXON_ID=3047 /ORGANISM="Dunaliella tertiolecta, Strain CCMP1320" /LENGTH=249 /DNA_ID=CAMNT_0048945395 /DNA_START=109 /DNA_END=858 /DNA_ORIENTATION=+